ncbi:VOC family protein [Paenibacillus ginsengarvi]|uniref:VOC family protein n=1 Tax=Paenibacillus ginsengarvi TaxID=400777 RepID=A0A3B0C7M2_9BACL|nr:VOC family protein [Paenibacillus ginsengarvi]RKN80568.1 VOC family protein [Paenibacillus ginsengarvi]
MQTNEETKVEQRLRDITGITCIYVPVNDVYESVKWYQKNLGCQPTKIHSVEPGMRMAILRFLDENGNPSHPATGPIPAIFLLKSEEEGGRLGFNRTEDGGKRQAVACFVTPHIKELFERFKENGVNIIGERVTCGPNVTFIDPDGNMWEIWQP